MFTLKQKGRKSDTGGDTSPGGAARASCSFVLSTIWPLPISRWGRENKTKQKQKHHATGKGAVREKAREEEVRNVSVMTKFTTSIIRLRVHASFQSQRQLLPPLSISENLTTLLWLHKKSKHTPPDTENAVIDDQYTLTHRAAAHKAPLRPWGSSPESQAQQGGVTGAGRNTSLGTGIGRNPGVGPHSFHECPVAHA